MGFKRTLDISDLLSASNNGEQAVQAVAEELLRRIRKLEASEDGELDEVLTRLSNISNDSKSDPEDLDCVLQDLYEWGDDTNCISILTDKKEHIENIREQTDFENVDFFV